MVEEMEIGNFDADKEPRNIVLISGFDTDIKEPQYTTFMGIDGILKWLNENYNINSKGKAMNNITIYANTITDTFFNPENAGKTHVIKYNYVREPWLYALAKFKYDMDLEKKDGAIKYSF